MTESQKHGILLMPLKSIVKMLTDSLDSYRIQAVFPCCNHYTAKKRICQVLFQKNFVVIQLQPVPTPKSRSDFSSWYQGTDQHHTVLLQAGIQMIYDVGV